MTGFIIAQLNEIIKEAVNEIGKEAGENKIKHILSSFSCPNNKDVEYFLHQKAMEFSKQGIATTYLVFSSFKGEPVLVGYFSLANKTLFVSKTSLSSNLRKRVNKFGTYIANEKGYSIAAPLIAQVGKNFANNYNSLITGDELLKLACDQVQIAQKIIGGKVVFLECEDAANLVAFYESNGFHNFGKRTLDEDEKNRFTKKYLIQMLKYLDPLG